MNRVSFNVNASRLGNKNYFLDFMSKYRPSSVVVMNAGHEFMKELLVATEFQTNIIRREYSELEGNQWKSVKPYDYVEKLTAGLDPNIWVYVLNEPAAHGDDLNIMLDWIINVGELLEAKGYHASLGNLGAAVWTAEEVRSGRFDTYLSRLADWSLRGIHYGGWHEYTGILAPFGVGQWIKEFLLHSELVQFNLWPTDLPIELIGEDFPPYWHLLRTGWFDLQADKIGVARHNKYITEWFLDRMPDLTAQTPNIYDELQQMYGLPKNRQGNPYSTMRGPMTMRNVYEGYYPGVPFEDVLFQQFKWAEKIYPTTVKGLHAFTWSFNEPTWDLKNGFDMSDCYQLHTRMIEDVDEPEPEPEPEIEPTFGWMIPVVEWLEELLVRLIDKLGEFEKWLRTH